MSPSLRLLHAALVAALPCLPVTACAQTLERKVNAAGDGAAQFHFAAREGVCGNGRSFVRIDDDSWYGSYSDGMGNDACKAGPASVTVTRAGGEIIRIVTVAGPLRADSLADKPLGAFPAREAGAYLLKLAATLEGRPAREALFAAVLADSTLVTPALTALVKDQARSRDLRRSAISWLARRRAEPGGVGAATIDRTLDALVKDRNEGESIRSQALSSLARNDRGDRGEGVETLMRYAGSDDAWLARKAFSSLSGAGDPRARKFVRDAVGKSDLSEEQRAEAIRGVGGEYAGAADFALLRDLYPKLNSDREREALLSTIGNAGGKDNVQWLVGIATSPTETASRRRKVVSLLSRSDDPRVREALKGIVER